MYCPEHLVFGKGGLWIWLYWRDVQRKSIPKKVWLNPFLYEVSFVRNGHCYFRINREGMAWGRLTWFFLKRTKKYKNVTFGRK